MKAWMTYNPKCGTARNVLEMIRAKGIEPTLREYLKDPLSKEELTALAKKAKVPLKDLVRWKEKDEVAAAKISEASSDAALLKALEKFPILLNRPIVTTPKGTRLCRPSESVAEIL
jgi:arsenate reductase